MVTTPGKKRQEVRVRLLRKSPAYLLKRFPLKVSELNGESYLLMRHAKMSAVDLCNLIRGMRNYPPNQVVGLINDKGEIPLTHQTLVKNEEELIFMIGGVRPVVVTKNRRNVHFNDIEGALLAALPCYNGPDYLNSCEKITCSPNAKFLAVSLGNCVKIYDPLTQNEMAKILLNASVFHLAFSPTDLIAILVHKVYRDTRGFSIRIFDVRTGMEVIKLTDSDNGASIFSFSPDGRMLASSTELGEVCLWVLPQEAVDSSNNHNKFPQMSAAPYRSVRGHTHPSTHVRNLNWSERSGEFVTCDPRHFALWDVQTLIDKPGSGAKFSYQQDSFCNPAIFSPDSLYVLTFNVNEIMCNATLYSTETGLLRYSVELFDPYDSSICCYLFSPDSLKVFFVTSDYDLALWDLTTWKLTKKINCNRIDYAVAGVRAKLWENSLLVVGTPVPPRKQAIFYNVDIDRLSQDNTTWKDVVSRSASIPFSLNDLVTVV